MTKIIIIFFMLSSVAFGGYSEFNQLNDMRADYGLYALRYDPALDQVARARVQKMVRRGSYRHPPGSYSPGKAEGTSNCGPENVCYSRTERFGSAGAATIGKYSCVVYGNVINKNGWIGQTTIGGTKENQRKKRTRTSRHPLRDFLDSFKR